MKTSPSPPIKYSSVGSNWPHTDGLLSIQENETYSASEQFSFYSILRHCAMYNTIYTVYYIIQQVKGPTTHNISTNIPAIYLHYKTETSNSQTSDAGKVNSLVFLFIPQSSNAYLVEDGNPTNCNCSQMLCSILYVHSIITIKAYSD